MVSEGRSLVLANGLSEAGYEVAAIRPPSIPKGHELLRITLHSFTTESQIKGLVDALHDLRSGD
jgi:8-amino-7-oxononanoate synthase